MSAGTAIHEFGNAAADLLNAQGSREEAKAYGTASTIAKSNAELTRRSTDIQEEQEQRVVTQAIGAETADTAAAGFKSGGSGFYLMKSSLEQGSLAKQLVENQGEITAQGYEQQSSAYHGQAQAAEFQNQALQVSAVAEAAAGAADTPSSVLSFLTLGIL